MGQDQYGVSLYKISGYYVNMTSQKWLTDADFAPTSQAKSIWWHILIIIVPDVIRFKNNGSLYITGNAQGMVYWNSSEDAILAQVLACSMNSITGVLFQVRVYSFSRRENNLGSNRYFRFQTNMSPSPPIPTTNLGVKTQSSPSLGLTSSTTLPIQLGSYVSRW